MHLRLSVRTMIAAMTATVLTSHAVHAQTIGRGLRIRVDAPGHLTAPATGTTFQSRAGWIDIMLDDDVARVEIPLAAVRRVDLYAGRRRARGALIGALIGGVTATAAGVAIGAAQSRNETFDIYPFALGVFGLLLGAPVGGIAGAIWAPTAWQEAPLFTAADSDSGAARVSVRSGVKLRVTPVSGARIRAISDNSDGTGIRVHNDDGATSYRWSDVAAIEMRGGRDRGLGAMYGATAGALLGAIPGGIDYARDRISGSELGRTVFFNAIIGGAVGALISPRGWVPLPVPRGGG